jgi:glycosyltransferase involved in cell wall biosynthesis
MNGVGLVHDYLLVLRGAERTFAAMADCFPRAPIHTTLYSARGTQGRFAGHPVHTSNLQHLGIRQRGFRALLPFFPTAVERLAVQDHDVVISSSSAFAHGVRPRQGAAHVCFCHSPFRYVWHERELALTEAPPTLRPMLTRTLDRIRAWDVEAAGRVTVYLAGSELVRRRIGDYYGRESAVLHPPVETRRFTPAEPEDFFLTVGEVVRHKRVDVAIEAARRAGRRIKVVGTGPELPRLRARHGDHVEFLGRLSDEELADLMPRAQALVVANVEEFGIAAVEAQAAGRPVLAVDAGGVRETVIDGVTGVRVPTGTVDEFAQAMRDVPFGAFDRDAIVRNAARFDVTRFRARLIDVVAAARGDRAVPVAEPISEVAA